MDRWALRAVVAAAAMSASAPRAARASDPFEIQIYDGTANAPGAFGLELHANRVLSGHRTSEPPELPTDRVTHLTLEPSYGVTPFLELGAYLQGALRGDGTFDYAGVKLRAKLVTPPRFHPHVRLGVNFELSALPSTYDRAEWGSEVRPILAWEDEHVILVVNPIVGVPWKGSDFQAGPTFEPAAMAKVKLFRHFAFGVEYYGDLGPIAHPLPVSQQQHALFGAMDLLDAGPFEINAGLGAGLTDGSQALTYKTIFGYAFD